MSFMVRMNAEAQPNGGAVPATPAAPSAPQSNVIPLNSEASAPAAALPVETPATVPTVDLAGVSATAEQAVLAELAARAASYQPHYMQPQPTYAAPASPAVSAAPPTAPTPPAPIKLGQTVEAALAQMQPAQAQVYRTLFTETAQASYERALAELTPRLQAIEEQLNPLSQNVERFVGEHRIRAETQAVENVYVQALAPLSADPTVAWLNNNAEHPISDAYAGRVLNFIQQAQLGQAVFRTSNGQVMRLPPGMPSPAAVQHHIATVLLPECRKYLSGVVAPQVAPASVVDTAQRAASAAPAAQIPQRPAARPFHEIAPRVAGGYV